MLHMLRFSKSVSDALWVVGAQAISMVALLLGTRLITEMLGPSDYGMVSLIVGGGALALNVFFNPVKQSLERFLPLAIKDGCSIELLEFLGVLSRKVVVVFFVLALLFFPLVLVFYKENWLAFVIGGFLVYAYQRRDFEISLLISSLRHRNASLMSAADAILRPACAVLTLYYVARTPEGVLVGYALSAMLVSLLAAWLVGKVKADFNNDRLPECIDNEYLKNFKLQIRQYAIPLVPLALFSWVTSTADRFFVSAMLGMADVGVYAVAYSVLYQCFWNGHVVLLKIFRPKYFSMVEKEDKKASASIYKKWFLVALGSMFFADIILFIMSEDIVRVLFSKEYSRAGALLPFMAVAFTFNVCTGLVQQIAFARKNSRLVTKVRALGALFALIITPCLLYLFGFTGVGYSMIAYFLFELMLMVGAVMFSRFKV